MIKKNIFKLASLTILVCIMLCRISVCAYAADNVDAYKLAVLQGLGIAPDTIRERSTMNRGDFAVWFAGALSDNVNDYADESVYSDVKGEYIAPVSLLKLNGFIDPNAETFMPRQPILVEQAAKIAVSALGYDLVAQRNGGYPDGYLDTARKIGILNGVTTVKGEGMKCYDVVNFMYNVITTDVAVHKVDGSEENLVATEGETLIALNRDIYVIEGIMTDNGRTALAGASSGVEGYVIIDGEKFKTAETFKEDYLGMNVEAYYNEETDALVCVIPIDNEVIELDYNNDITVNNNFSLLKYLVDGKTEKVKLSPALNVIYNGEAYGEYTAEDFELASGRMKLIDNDDDKIYDVVIITEYRTFVVESVSALSKEILNAYTYDEKLTNFNIDSSNINLKVMFDGEVVEPSKIAVNDVLSLEISKNETNPLTIVYISRESFMSVATSFDDEGRVSIDGLDYELSEDYKAALEAQDFAATQIKLGTEYEFFLDIDGKIAYIKEPADEKEMVAYMKHIGKQSEAEDEIFVKVFNHNQEWLTLKFAEKLTYVQGSYEKKLEDTEVYDKLVAPTGNANADAPKIIKYKLNAEGDIREISVPITGTTGEEGYFNVEGPFSSGYGSRAKNLDNYAYLSDDTKVFVLPTDSNAPETSYAVRPASYVVEGSVYNFYNYDFDEFGFVDILVLMQGGEADEQSVVDASMFIVDKVVTMWVDEENRQVAFGSYGGYSKISIVAAEQGVLDGVKYGDALQLILNPKGEILRYVKRWGMSDENAFENSATCIVGDKYMHQGTVIASDPSASRIKIDNGMDKQTLRLDKNLPIAVLDANGEVELRYGTPSDIAVGDFVITRTIYHYPQEMIVVKF